MTGPGGTLLSSVGLVDHHAHGILTRAPASLDEFRGLFSESPDPRQWPHVATQAAYRRGIAELAEQLGCDPREEAVLEVRLASDPDEYAASLLRATGTEVLLVDDGFPPPGEGPDWRRMGELAGCRSLPVLRLETHDPAEVPSARQEGFAALKTIAAYRGGLRLDDDHPLWAALEANEETGAPLPVQVHCGFGDSDLLLPLSDPGWLAHVYANVYSDLSLTIPHVARPAEAVREALELAPFSKLLYGSDAARTPELYFLAAKRWRDALADVLPELLGLDAEEAARDPARQRGPAVRALTRAPPRRPRRSDRLRRHHVLRGSDARGRPGWHGSSRPPLRHGGGS